MFVARAREASRSDDRRQINTHTHTHTHTQLRRPSRATGTLVSGGDDTADADRLVLPGVGAFPDGMKELNQRGLTPAIRDFYRRGKPLLGICLGMQLMCAWSEENNTDCLGIFEEKVKRFQNGEGDHYKIPQIGWNQIEVAQPDCPIFRGIDSGSYVYFVHSFYPKPADPSIVATRTEYGELFASSIWRDNVFATQFHPEKSQTVGLKLLRNFVELCS